MSGRRKKYVSHSGVNSMLDSKDFHLWRLEDFTDCYGQVPKEGDGAMYDRYKAWQDTLKENARKAEEKRLDAEYEQMHNRKPDCNRIKEFRRVRDRDDAGSKYKLQKWTEEHKPWFDKFKDKSVGPEKGLYYDFVPDSCYPRQSEMSVQAKNRAFNMVSPLTFAVKAAAGVATLGMGIGKKVLPKLAYKVALEPFEIRVKALNKVAELAAKDGLVDTFRSCMGGHRASGERITETKPTECIAIAAALMGEEVNGENWTTTLKDLSTIAVDRAVDMKLQKQKKKALKSFKPMRTPVLPEGEFRSYIEGNMYKSFINQKLKKLKKLKPKLREEAAKAVLGAVSDNIRAAVVGSYVNALNQVFGPSEQELLSEQLQKYDLMQKCCKDSRLESDVMKKILSKGLQKLAPEMGANYKREQLRCKREKYLQKQPCLCPAGTPVGGIDCTMCGAVNCASCDDGFKLSAIGGTERFHCVKVDEEDKPDVDATYDAIEKTGFKLRRALTEAERKQREKDGKNRMDQMQDKSQFEWYKCPDKLGDLFMKQETVYVNPKTSGNNDEWLNNRVYISEAARRLNERQLREAGIDLTKTRKMQLCQIDYDKSRKQGGKSEIAADTMWKMLHDSVGVTEELDPAGSNLIRDADLSEVVVALNDEQRRVLQAAGERLGLPDPVYTTLRPTDYAIQYRAKRRHGKQRACAKVLELERQAEKIAKQKQFFMRKIEGGMCGLKRYHINKYRFMPQDQLFGCIGFTGKYEGKLGNMNNAHIDSYNGIRSDGRWLGIMSPQTLRGYDSSYRVEYDSVYDYYPHAVAQFPKLGGKNRYGYMNKGQRNGGDRKGALWRVKRVGNGFKPNTDYGWNKKNPGNFGCQRFTDKPVEEEVDTYLKGKFGLYNKVTMKTDLDALEHCMTCHDQAPDYSKVTRRNRDENVSRLLIHSQYHDTKDRQGMLVSDPTRKDLQDKHFCFCRTSLSVEDEWRNFEANFPTEKTLDRPQFGEGVTPMTMRKVAGPLNKDQKRRYKQRLSNVMTKLDGRFTCNFDDLTSDKFVCNDPCTSLEGQKKVWTDLTDADAKVRSMVDDTNTTLRWTMEQIKRINEEDVCKNGQIPDEVKEMLPKHSSAQKFCALDRVELAAGQLKTTPLALNAVYGLQTLHASDPRVKIAAGKQLPSMFELTKPEPNPQASWKAPSGATVNGIRSTYRAFEGGICSFDAETSCAAYKKKMTSLFDRSEIHNRNNPLELKFIKKSREQLDELEEVEGHCRLPTSLVGFKKVIDCEEGLRCNAGVCEKVPEKVAGDTAQLSREQDDSDSNMMCLTLDGMVPCDAKTVCETSGDNVYEAARTAKLTGNDVVKIGARCRARSDEQCTFGFNRKANICFTEEEQCNQNENVALQWQNNRCVNLKQRCARLQGTYDDTTRECRNTVGYQKAVSACAARGNPFKWHDIEAGVEGECKNMQTTCAVGTAWNGEKCVREAHKLVAAHCASRKLPPRLVACDVTQPLDAQPDCCGACVDGEVMVEGHDTYGCVKPACLQYTLNAEGPCGYTEAENAAAEQQCHSQGAQYRWNADLQHCSDEKAACEEQRFRDGHSAHTYVEEGGRGLCLNQCPDGIMVGTVCVKK